MALQSNALTSLASLRAFMRSPPQDADLLSVYHDGSASATAATVQVTGSAIVLVITGGANAGTSTLTFAAYATVTTMVTAINALSKGWVATVQGNGGEATADLNVLSATSGFGSAAVQYLRGKNSYLFEKAINAASDAIEHVTNRSFASASYRQALHGSGRPQLRLRQFPVTAIVRVAIGTKTGLSVQNTSSDAKHATIANDGTNLTLTIVGGTNAGSDDVAISTNTMTQLVAAIIAVGKSWTASTTQGDWPGTELLKHQARFCLNNLVDLQVPDDPEEAYDLYADAGIIERGFGGIAQLGMRFGPTYNTAWNTAAPQVPHNPGSALGNHWPKGVFNIIVEYTAGYSTIPVELEMLCNKLAANIIRSGTYDGNLASTSGPGFSESYRGESAMTSDLRRELGAHRQHYAPAYMDV